MFWAEAADTEVASIATAMPVTSMPLTPRLKRVWRRINKPNGSPRRAPTIPQAHHLTISLASGQKYDLRVPGVRRSCGPAPVGLRRAYPGGEDFRKRPIVLGHLPRRPSNPVSESRFWAALVSVSEALEARNFVFAIPSNREA